MRLLITMNMPSAAGNNVHQITVEHKSQSLAEFLECINSDVFVMLRIYYRRSNIDGTVFWQDKGDIIINTGHIGKVQEYFEHERSENFNDAPELSTRSVQSSGGARGPIRPSRSVF